MAKLKLMSMTSTNTMVKNEVLKESQQNSTKGMWSALSDRPVLVNRPSFVVSISSKSYKRSNYVNGYDLTDPKNQCWSGPWKYQDGFPTFQPLPYMSVLENIMFAPVEHKLMTREEAQKVGMELLEKKLDSDKADANPNSPSGGQKTTWPLPVDTAMNPDIMLFDEPTSAPDPEMVGDVLNVMKELAEQGMTMIIVTHEMGFAPSSQPGYLYRRRWIPRRRQTRPNLRHPQHPRLKEFLDKVLNV